MLLAGTAQHLPPQQSFQMVFKQLSSISKAACSGPACGLQATKKHRARKRLRWQKTPCTICHALAWRSGQLAKSKPGICCWLHAPRLLALSHYSDRSASTVPTYCQRGRHRQWECLEQPGLRSSHSQTCCAASAGEATLCCASGINHLWCMRLSCGAFKLTAACSSWSGDGSFDGQQGHLTVRQQPLQHDWPARGPAMQQGHASHQHARLQDWSALEVSAAWLMMQEANVELQ